MLPEDPKKSRGTARNQQSGHARNFIAQILRNIYVERYGKKVEVKDIKVDLLAHKPIKKGRDETLFEEASKYVRNVLSVIIVPTDDVFVLGYTKVAVPWCYSFSYESNVESGVHSCMHYLWRQVDLGTHLVSSSRDAAPVPFVSLCTFLLNVSRYFNCDGNAHEALRHPLKTERDLYMETKEKRSKLVTDKRKAREEEEEAEKPKKSKKKSSKKASKKSSKKASKKKSSSKSSKKSSTKKAKKTSRKESREPSEEPARKSKKKKKAPKESKVCFVLLHHPQERDASDAESDAEPKARAKKRTKKESRKSDSGEE
jgi:hypothetical protein